jgi:hypothetical protein
VAAEGLERGHGALLPYLPDLLLLVLLLLLA